MFPSLPDLSASPESSGSCVCWGPSQGIGVLVSRAAHRGFRKRNRHFKSEFKTIFCIFLR